MIGNNLADQLQDFCKVRKFEVSGSASARPLGQIVA
jgi:hypothetical protein